jgi:threonine synthase
MDPMMYISTRGGTPAMGFQEAVMTGLAPDGGLLIPSEIPDVRDRLAAWSKLSYQDITFEVLRRYVDLPDDDLRALIDRSYAAFSDPEIAPAWKKGPVYILELFYGPTLAFKDIALQFLSNFFQYILDRTDRRLNILGATSGDTGSAAIHGVRGRDRIHIFIMHPHGRVAPLQEKQMTAVLDPNVFNIAVDGTFDDCQRIMKNIFQDLDFKSRYALGAINSVNWARVLVQIVYYFSAGLYVWKQTGAARVRFAVPTGNFGDILAGYYAARMGLPVGRLVLATNENDILTRFFTNGVYRQGEVVKTISPSMDIQVASNFERYLYYRLDRDSTRLRGLMDQFRQTGELTVPLKPGEPVDSLLAAGVGHTGQTLATIRRYWEEYEYLMDPHTAVGVSVAEQHLREDEPMICLATAHPAKFSQAIRDAIGREARHPALDALAHAPTRCAVLPADEQAVREYIAAHALV